MTTVLTTALILSHLTWMLAVNPSVDTPKPRGHQSSISVGRAGTMRGHEPHEPRPMANSPWIGASRGVDSSSTAGAASRWVEGHLEAMGPWAPIAFVLLFVVCCILCVPAAFLTLAAGALFGVMAGILYVWIGAMLGAAAAFLVARHALGGFIQRRLEKYPRLAALEQAVTEEGWRIVLLSRLAPGSPFFLLNYLFGITRVGFLEYLAATAVSVIPGSLLLVYMGSLGQLAAAGGGSTWWTWALRGVGLLALVGVVMLISRRARIALEARLRPSPTAGASPTPEPGKPSDPPPRR